MERDTNRVELGFTLQIQRNTKRKTSHEECRVHPQNLGFTLVAESNTNTTEESYRQVEMAQTTQIFRPKDSLQNASR